MGTGGVAWLGWGRGMGVAGTAWPGFSMGAEGGGVWVRVRGLAVKGERQGYWSGGDMGKVCALALMGEGAWRVRGHGLAGEGPRSVGERQVEKGGGAWQGWQRGGGPLTQHSEQGGPGHPCVAVGTRRGLALVAPIILQPRPHDTQVELPCGTPRQPQRTQEPGPPALPIPV